MTKFIFVTGGVVSSLGKGIAAASIATILESLGLNVTMLKLDPYINVDPGTMSPFQHGEVFVVKKDPSLTKEELIAFCRTELTGYKVPKDIEFRDELPKSNVGKILRRELREQALGK